MNAVVAMSHQQYWYEQPAGAPFRQGDIFRGVAAAWLPDDFSPDRDPIVEVKTGDWIVLEASCDLDQRRCLQVLLARIQEANAANLKTKDSKSLDQRLEVIRRGGYVTRFMLSPHDEAGFPLSFVEFNTRVLLPLAYLERAAKQSILRLKSPLREQFGNWVGSCFSRVGPENEALIPAFVQPLHDAHRLKALDE